MIRQGDDDLTNEKPDYLLLRIISATCLLAVLNAWSVKHLGTGINDFALINGLALCLGWVLGFVNQSEKERVEQAWRRIIYGFLQGPVLVVFALLGLTLSLFVTSITLTMDDTDQARNIAFIDRMTNSPIATRVISAEAPTVRYIFWTTPFGRSLSMDVEGFLRHSVEVLPWSGKWIQVDRELSPTPTLLLRMPMRKLKLLNAATLTIKLDGSKPHTLITESGRGAVRIGPSRSLPLDVLTGWKVSLLATTEQEEKSIARVVWQWQNILDAPFEITLVPGTQVDVVLKNNASAVLAEVSFEVGNQAFQDVLLKPRNIE